MGLDLTVCLISYPNTWWWLGNNRLSFDRCYYLFEQIMNRGRQEPEDKIEQVCQPKPLPPDVKFDWYGDEGIEEEKTDPYGDPLTFCYAHEFNEIKTDENIGPWNNAILIFLKSLPPNTPVVLWWH